MCLKVVLVEPVVSNVNNTAVANLNLRVLSYSPLNVIFLPKCQISREAKRDPLDLIAVYLVSLFPPQPSFLLSQYITKQNALWSILWAKQNTGFDRESTRRVIASYMSQLPQVSVDANMHASDSCDSACAKLPACYKCSISGGDHWEKLSYMWIEIVLQWKSISNFITFLQWKGMGSYSLSPRGTYYE